MNNGTSNFGTIARLNMSPVVRNNLATQPPITHADNSPEFSAVLDRRHSSLHVSFVVTPAGGAAPAKQGHNAEGDPVIRRFPSGFTIELESYIFLFRISQMHHHACVAPRASS
jgi:hypothetical protein